MLHDDDNDEEDDEEAGAEDDSGEITARIEERENEEARGPREVDLKRNFTFNPGTSCTLPCGKAASHLSFCRLFVRLSW